MRTALITLLLVVVPGCAHRQFTLRAFPKCNDGLPIRVLVNPACPPDGICGYSCLPDRWKEPR